MSAANMPSLEGLRHATQIRKLFVRRPYGNCFPAGNFIPDGRNRFMGSLRISFSHSP